MWNLRCLVAVSLVVASYQRAPVRKSSDNDGGGGALGRSAFAHQANGRQNIGNTEVPTVLDPAVTPTAVQNDTCPPCTCGALGKKLGIVGGNFTYVNEYPWMAMLLNDSQFFCGGSLINDRYVITAAHCVNRLQEEAITVRLLEYDRSTTTDSESKDYTVLDVIMHKEYDPMGNDNDIALLRLSTKVTISPESKIHPVCLPEKGENFIGYQGVITGWGFTREYDGKPPGPASDVLKQVVVPIVSNEECRVMYDEYFYGAFNITDNMICDGYEDGGEDSCQGDSGGPLHVIKNNASYHIVGIVSWSIGCAEPEFFGVNTRVNKYLDWLADNTKDACPCNNVYDPSKNHE